MGNLPVQRVAYGKQITQSLQGIRNLQQRAFGVVAHPPNGLDTRSRDTSRNRDRDTR